MWQGLMSRVYETTMVLALLAVVVLGIAWVVSSLINEDHHSKQQLFGTCALVSSFIFSKINAKGVN